MHSPVKLRMNTKDFDVVIHRYGKWRFFKNREKCIQDNGRAVDAFDRILRPYRTNEVYYARLVLSLKGH